MKYKREVTTKFLMRFLSKMGIKKEDLWVEYYPSWHARSRWVKFWNKLLSKEEPLGVVILHKPTTLWAQCDERGVDTQYNYECCLLELYEAILDLDNEDKKSGEM